jgi:hypothetical protein
MRAPMERNGKKVKNLLRTARRDPGWARDVRRVRLLLKPYDRRDRD